MAKTHPPKAPEHRHRMIELVRAGSRRRSSSLRTKILESLQPLGEVRALSTDCRQPDSLRRLDAYRRLVTRVSRQATNDPLRWSGIRSVVEQLRCLETLTGFVQFRNGLLLVRVVVRQNRYVDEQVCFVLVQLDMRDESRIVRLV